MSCHSYFLAKFVSLKWLCSKTNVLLFIKDQKKTSGDLLGEGLGVTDQCPKELVCLWEDLLRISCLIIMIIRNIFVFTLALSDLLLTASVPFTVIDALTQVQDLMFNKCNTMFSKYVDILHKPECSQSTKIFILGTHLFHLFFFSRRHGLFPIRFSRAGLSHCKTFLLHCNYPISLLTYQ